MGQNDKRHNTGSSQGQSSVTPTDADDIKSSADVGTGAPNAEGAGPDVTVEPTAPAATTDAQKDADAQAAANVAAADAEAAAKAKAKEDEKKKAEAAAKNVNALGLSDVIKATITRADMSLNGSAMLSVESIIDVLLLYPYAQIEVNAAHVAAIFDYIKTVERTKKFAAITEKARTLAIFNWKTKYGLKD